MPRIDRIEITQHSCPIDPPFLASWDGRPRERFEATLVRITDSDGRTGIGSGDLMLGFAGHEELFLGQDPRDIRRHHTVLSHLDFHYGRCWPFDLALWDLIGQIEETPVWRLLGGRHAALPLYASLGVQRAPEAMAEQAAALVAEGFRALKIRLAAVRPGSAEDNRDVRVLSAVRAAVGADVRLMVDCNQGWRMPWDTSPPWTQAEAAAVIDRLSPYDVYWFEEPLHHADVAGMAALRRDTGARIAGGEMTRDPALLRQLIAAGAVDVLQPDVALVQGITGVAELVKAAGITFTPHSWTNGIGVMANAQTAAGVGTSERFEWPYDPPDWAPATRDFLLAEPLDHARGVFPLPEAPGLGLVLDEDRVAATRV